MQLSIAKRGKIMQCHSGNKVKIVRELESCLYALHVLGTNSYYSANCLMTNNSNTSNLGLVQHSNKLKLFIIWHRFALLEEESIDAMLCAEQSASFSKFIS